MSRLVRTFHQAEKHPANPVLLADLPWERSLGHNHGTVIFEEDRFRFWYQVFATAGEAEGTFHCAYAESTDGINWTKPDFDLLTINGAPGRNIVAYDIGGVNIIRDDRDPDEARRYKLLYWGSGKEKPGTFQKWMGADGHWAWCVAFSPDGFRWTPHPDNPVYTGAGDDGSFLGWDENEGKYVAYLRPCVWKPGHEPPTPDTYDMSDGGWHGWYNGGPVPVDEKMRQFPHQRLIGRAVSEDFVDWSPTETVIAPDETDPPATEFYSMPAFRYQDWIIGLAYMLYGDPEEGLIRKKGFMDIQLAASRDGITWLRLGEHEPFIPRGDRGTFDMGMVGPNNGLIERDGKIWFYYNGWAGEHRETKTYRRANDPGHFEMGRLCSGIGLATLRQDGFISIDAGEDEGVLVTPPEELSGQTLVINAVTWGTGEITVEVLDRKGSAVAGYCGESCVPFGGDSVSHPVTWKGGTLGGLDKGEYALKFQMRNASLYAYWSTP